MRTVLAFVAGLLLAGCRTVAPATREIDPETLPLCTRACSAVGMKLAGIVFVDEYGGCVCQVTAPGEKADAAGPAAEGAALSSAMAVIQEARKRRQRAQSPPPR